MTTKQSLHRAIKILLQRKLISTIEEGEKLLRQFRIGVRVHSDCLSDRGCQVALATIANAGARVFLGGVFVDTQGIDSPKSTDLMPEPTVGQSVQALGATWGDIPSDTPTILIGAVDSDEPRDLRISVNGWSGGVVSAFGDWVLDSAGLPIAYVLAASIALGEMFRLHSGDITDFTGVSLGTSLLDPSVDWLEGQRLSRAFIPDRVWVLGLGHLGQAYIWTLASLLKNCTMELYLQDDGRIEPANFSTGVLTFGDVEDALKTRVIAGWCENIGINTRLVERRFGSDLRLQDGEPRILLSGLDNPGTRRLLEGPGFNLIIDGGLSPLGNSYDWFTVKTFTGEGRAEIVFSQPTRGMLPSEDELSAYRKAGANECGVAELGAVAVGVPFVGLVAACFVVAEAMRALSGQPLRVNLAGRVQKIDSLEFASGDFFSGNPGFREV